MVYLYITLMFMSASNQDDGNFRTEIGFLKLAIRTFHIIKSVLSTNKMDYLGYVFQPDHWN